MIGPSCGMQMGNISFSFPRFSRSLTQCIHSPSQQWKHFRLFAHSLSTCTTNRKGMLWFRGVLFFFIVFDLNSGGGQHVHCENWFLHRIMGLTCFVPKSLRSLGSLKTRSFFQCRFPTHSVNCCVITLRNHFKRFTKTCLQWRAWMMPRGTESGYRGGRRQWGGSGILCDVCHLTAASRLWIRVLPA